MRRKKPNPLEPGRRFRLDWGIWAHVIEDDWFNLFAVAYDPFTKEIFAQGRFRADWVSPEPFKTQQERFMADLLKQALEARKKAGKAATTVEAEGWLAKVPVIEAMLKQGTLEGKPRATSTLTLMVDGGKCKVMLKDRQSHELTWGEGETFLDALVGLEERIGEGMATWQEDRFNKQNSPKK